MSYSKLASVGATRALLDEFGLRAKYKLGQNFLVDDGVVGRILKLADLQPNEAILEVGPGIGTLTSAMLPLVGAVVAIEADQDMTGPLSVSCADYSERLTVISGDAMRVGAERVHVALAELRDRQHVRVGAPDLPDMPSKVVSNLPYAVAARLILGWMQNWPQISCEVVMVQREVADRISAVPSTKEYGAYTAKLALHARVTGRFEVSHASFFPAPHVESAVVRIERLASEDRLTEKAARECSALIDAAFSQRRKTMRNALMRSGYPADILDAAMQQCGLDARVRAEALGRAEFIGLYEAIAQRTDVWPVSLR